MITLTYWLMADKQYHFSFFFFFDPLILQINKNLISLSHSKHTLSPRNAHSASAEGTDPV